MGFDYFLPGVWRERGRMMWDRAEDSLRGTNMVIVISV